MAVSFPAIDLRNDIRDDFSTAGYSLSLFHNQKQLWVGKFEVVIVQGATISKKLIYDDPVVSATYTTFSDQPVRSVKDRGMSGYGTAKNNQNNIEKPFAGEGEALVVCLQKSAHIYYDDGRQYMVSFPFSLKKALPFDFGLILEKELSFVLDIANPPAFHLAKFLTLVDPIGDFRLVSTSSTSVVSPNEQLISFPNRMGLAKSISCLCATYNRHDSTVVLYQVRSPTRPTKIRITGNQSHGHSQHYLQSSHFLPSHSSNINSKYFKRKSSMVAGSPSGPSRILEDDEYSNIAEANSNANSNGIGNNGNLGFPNGATSNNINPTVHVSINMEKKRTSTLLSDISSIARMGSESGFYEPLSKKHVQDPTALLKKDLILTKLDTFLISESDVFENQVHTLKFEDQEALIIVSPSKAQATVYIYTQLPSHSYRFQSSYTINCTSCIPLNYLKHPGFVVALSGSSLKLINPFLDISSKLIHLSKQFPDIKTLQCSMGSMVSILSSKQEKFYNIQLCLEPLNELVSKILQSFKYLSGSKIRETLWLIWCSSVTIEDDKDDWNALVITLLSIIYPFDLEQTSPNDTNYIVDLLPKAKIIHDTIVVHIQYSFTDLIPFMVLSLHLIQEELRLDSLNSFHRNKLSFLLTQLTTWMGWSESWTLYYFVDGYIDTLVQFLLVSIIDRPPNLLESLSSLFGTQGKIVKYLTFSQLAEEDELIDKIVTPRTYCILKLFEVLVSNSYGPNDLVDMMCEYGITPSILETYPSGIYLPLKQAILVCQEHPAFEWTSEALDLVGRKDLSKFLAKEANGTQLPVGVIVPPAPSSADVLQVLNNVFEKPDTVTAWDGQSEADRISITKLIFDYDRRYFEITTLLHQTKIQTAFLKTDSGVGEEDGSYDIVLLQRELAALVAMRTLTIPLGRAALFYGSRMPLVTERFPIPKFNFNCLISPSMLNIVLNRQSLNESMCEWGYFHNGVSSGLSILPDSKGISGLWIIFNKPPDLNSQHAGFLLGLGLNGHLKKLEEWHIYNYLGPKHPLTSVGLLLGMSASLKGTMDNKLTKVLSVHAVALLPQGANDLNVPIIVQTAGLIGIGLLYLGSQHRRMSEILLSQITASVFQNDVEQIHEGYRLAAGIALGFVNIGKGNDLKGLNDTHVIDKLLNLATSMKDFQTSQELDKSCCGAIVALGFIYMKTGNHILANKLKVPDTDRLLDYIRPDLLLLRCISRNIINWESIEGSVEWVLSEIPKCLSKKYLKENGSIMEDLDLDSDQLGFFNILGGICVSLATRYASTCNIKVRDTLIHFLDMMMTVSSKPAKNYDQKVAHNCATGIRNLLAICISIVMTASGDLETFRRLRILQGDTRKEKMGYGGYMAINMALGFLFLGGGQYAWSNSNFAIACLITSIYPVFPSNSQTSNYGWEVHLQALRHFWALSVEPRCLVIRDVISNRPCKVPVTIHKVGGEFLKHFHLVFCRISMKFDRLQLIRQIISV